MIKNRNNISFIPPLLPNQTLYSWVAIFHEKSGNATVNETLLQMFGLLRKNLHFHIPSHLDRFCAFTQLALGTPEAIIQTATTIPFYTKFRKSTVTASVLKLVRSNSSHGVAQALGMSKNVTYTHPPRRSCLKCIQADQAEYGFAYWRRDHQLPGVLVCTKHGTTLLSIPYDHDSIRSETLLWPNDDWSLFNTSTLPIWPNNTLIHLDRLARLAADMASCNLEGGYLMRKMQSACHPILVKRNLIASDGSLLVAQALHDYGNHFKSIAAIPEFLATSQSTIRPLLLLLKQVDRRSHPLEWMLIIDWLFGDWTTFQKSYQQPIVKLKENL